MEQLPNPSTSKELRLSQQLALSDCRQSQDRLDELLAGCFTLQKMYGRAPDSMETVTLLFHSLLGKFAAEKVTRAFELWLERSQEFPTPADIISLIKRNGKPALRESDIITIRKKDGEDRTSDEWAMLKEWEAEQQNGWGDPDPVKDEAMLQENIQLRKKIIELSNELSRMNTLLHQERMRKGIEPPKPDMAEKVRRTIEAMKNEGAKQEDIDAFASQYGIAA